jgi:hypothetical protein
MRLISTILRIIANVFLFCLYAFIAIIVENFIFGLILVNVWKTVPGTEDPIHMALAIATTWFIALITFIFRNTFYVSLNRNESVAEEKVIIEKVVEQKEDMSKEEESFDEEMKIYIDKEIK